MEIVVLGLLICICTALGEPVPTVYESYKTTDDTTLLANRDTVNPGSNFGLGTRISGGFGSGLGFGTGVGAGIGHRFGTAFGTGLAPGLGSVLGNGYAPGLGSGLGSGIGIGNGLVNGYGTGISSGVDFYNNRGYPLRSGLGINSVNQIFPGGQHGQFGGYDFYDPYGLYNPRTAGDLNSFYQQNGIGLNGYGGRFAHLGAQNAGFGNRFGNNLLTNDIYSTRFPNAFQRSFSNPLYGNLDQSLRFRHLRNARLNPSVPVFPSNVHQGRFKKGAGNEKVIVTSNSNINRHKQGKPGVQIVQGQFSRPQYDIITDYDQGSKASSKIRRIVKRYPDISSLAKDKEA